MRFFTILSFLFIKSIPLYICMSRDFVPSFENWANEFKIQFTSNQHVNDMLEKWTENDNYIQEINSQNLPFTLGHNQFSGMNHTDFLEDIKQNAEFGRRIPKQNYKTIFRDNLPESVNWVKEGAVTPVKEQGSCGSCWSFSTTGALEGAYFIKTGTLVSFSEQQLVDCDNLRYGGHNHGCNGGLMDSAFEWIAENGGLCSEKDYPYISGDGSKNPCQKTCKEVDGSEVVDYIDVYPSDDFSMMLALSQQPVSIAIDASGRDFQLYKSGVFTATCGIDLDHGVLAVGYGSENGRDYYLVKNSWGTSWGDKGYIKLGRGTQYNGGDGQCGMLLEGSYPLL